MLGVETSPAHRGFYVSVHAEELMMMLSHMHEELIHEIAKVVKKVMAEAKSETRQWMVQKGRMVTERGSAANKIALTLDYEPIEVSTGSILARMVAGPAYTNPDDNGQVFDLAPAYEDGMAARWVYYTGKSGKKTAKTKGRQVGRQGGETPFVPGGKYFHPGFPELGYMAHAEDIVTRRLQSRIQSKIEKTYGPGTFYRR